MKIGIVVWDLDISGGTQRQALELAIGLQSRGHKVVVYTAYYDNIKCYPELLAKLDIRYLHTTHKEIHEITTPVAIVQRFLSTPQLRHVKILKMSANIFKLIDPDLDLLNIHDQLTYLLVSPFKAKYKKPVVWMMNDSPLKDTNYSKYAFKKISSLIWRKIVRNNVKKIDDVIVLDESSKMKALKYFNKDATIIRSGLDITNYNILKNSKNLKLKILSTGIFLPHRRFEDLILALKIIKDKWIDFECNHVGSDNLDPKYAAKIYQIVQEMDLTANVKFHGYVPEKTLIDFYSTSDIFVFPNYPQTWGLAVFEAMACGTPVICTTGAGAHEVLTDGHNAILVPPKSPEKIAENIIKLYSDDKLWDNLHKNGRQFVEENITWDIYSKNMLTVFNETVKRKHESSLVSTTPATT